MALAIAAGLGGVGDGAVAPTPYAGLLLQAGFVPESFDAEVPLHEVSARSVLIQHPIDDAVVPSFMAKDLAA